MDCRVPTRLIPDLMREAEALLNLGEIKLFRSTPVVFAQTKYLGLQFCVDILKLNTLFDFDPCSYPKVFQATLHPCKR